MSTRTYPLFLRGNPQLRIFLPNFWMKLIKPKYDIPKNMVEFIVSMQMTKFDVKNYLEKIYNIQVVEVRTDIVQGEFRKCEDGYIVKDEDYKIAYVTLPKDQSFEFPNLFPTKKQTMDEDFKKLKELKIAFKKSIAQHAMRPNIPTWFGL